MAKFWNSIFITQWPGPSLGLLLCWLATAPVAFAARSQPNVVIILADDQGYADTGTFGARGFTTPHLDRMASEGIRFTDFHVPQGVCSASRAGLLTGCYPNRVGIHGALGPEAKIGLSTNEMTIADVLKKRGYATGMFGKWHLGSRPPCLPLQHGFDTYFGLPYSNDMWPFHPEAKPGTYPPLPLIEGNEVVKNGLGHEDQEQLTTWYTERATLFIEANRNRPFFLYVAPNMPHVPLHVSDKFRGKSAKGLYGDVIMEIDWSVGEILAALKRCGVDRDTLVIFTSDNGPWLSYGEHAGSAFPLREGKGTSWEGGTRVPFIARWPGKIPAGGVCREMAMTIDLLPTIAKWTGAPMPNRPIDGLDISPLLLGKHGAKNPHPAYFFYYAQNELQAVRSGPWKLVLPHEYRTLNGRPGGRDGFPVKYEQTRLSQPELYDLSRDWEEKRNVAAENPKVVRRLEMLAEKSREDLGDSLTKRTGKGAREPGRIPPGPAIESPK